MALARTNVGIFSKLNAGTPAFTTEEFTPPANSLLVVRVYRMRKEGESEMGVGTIEGGGLTWTNRGANTTLKPAWSTKATWFTAPVGGSPAKMAITVDDPSNLNIYEYVVSVLAYTGYDTTTPIGGIVSSGTSNIGDGEESRELSEAPRAEDETLLCIDVDATKAPPTPSLETGWSTVHEKSASAESGLAIASRTGSTSKTVKVKDVYVVSGGTLVKAGLGALVVRAATESGDVTIAAPTAVAILSSASPLPTVSMSAPTASVVAGGSVPTPSASIGAVSAGASASATAPGLSAAVAAPSASAVAGAAPPTPGASVASPGGSAVAGAAAPVPSATLQSPAAQASAGAAAPGMALTVVAPSAVIVVAMPAPEVIIAGREAPLSDLPTTLALFGAASSLAVSVSASSLMVEGPSAALEVEGGVSNTLTTEGPTSDLAPESPGSRLVPDAPSTELGLDG
jgi:hypothetical protein